MNTCYKYTCHPYILQTTIRLAGNSSYSSRSYRVVEVASNKLEDRAVRMISVLYFSSVMWVLLPDSIITGATRALIFRILSRLGCSIEELLRHPHRDMKFAVFLLLLEQEGTPDLLLSREWCTLCPWSQGVFTEFWESFAGDDMMAYLAY